MKKELPQLKKQLINIGVFLALIAITFFFIFKNTKSFTFANVSDFFLSIHWPFLVVAFLCMVMNMGFKSLSLRNLTTALGYKRKQTQYYSYSSAEIYFSAITPSATGGQPASAYYMVKDGIPLTITTAVLSFNLFLYTASLIFVALLAFLIRPWLFFQLDLWVQLFVIAGVVIQGVFLAIYLSIMFSQRLVMVLARWAISVGSFFRIIKDKDAYMARINQSVNRFRNSVKMISKNKRVALISFLFNCCDRLAYVTIGVMVFYGAKHNIPSLSNNTDLLDNYALQTFALVGGYCVPLPGAVGASELLTDRILSLVIADPKMLSSAMIITRGINFYLCTLLAAVVTLIHHVKVHFFRKDETPEPPPDDGEKT